MSIRRRPLTKLPLPLPKVLGATLILGSVSLLLGQMVSTRPSPVVVPDYPLPEEQAAAPAPAPEPIVEEVQAAIAIPQAVPQPEFVAPPELSAIAADGYVLGFRDGMKRYPGMTTKNLLEVFQALATAENLNEWQQGRFLGLQAAILHIIESRETANEQYR